MGRPINSTAVFTKGISTPKNPHTTPQRIAKPYWITTSKLLKMYELAYI
jgi:hypothetical protein